MVIAFVPVNAGPTLADTESREGGPWRPGKRADRRQRDAVRLGLAAPDHDLVAVERYRCNELVLGVGRTREHEAPQSLPIRDEVWRDGPVRGEERKVLESVQDLALCRIPEQREAHVVHEHVAQLRAVLRHGLRRGEKKGVLRHLARRLRQHANVLQPVAELPTKRERIELRNEDCCRAHAFSPGFLTSAFPSHSRNSPARCSSTACATRFRSFPLRPRFFAWYTYSKSSGDRMNRTLTSHAPGFSRWKCGGSWSSELIHASQPGKDRHSSFPTGTA